VEVIKVILVGKVIKTMPYRAAPHAFLPAVLAVYLREYALMVKGYRHAC
jgi:hypothetical protein